MRLVLISDTHNRAVKLPDGDTLIHSGDWTNRGTQKEIEAFVEWIAGAPHRNKIVVAGNHDIGMQTNAALRLLVGSRGITYLQDSAVYFDGLKFYGSPWQPWFNDWAFNLPRGGTELVTRWGWIPNDTDVLITHGPPMYILDRNTAGEHVGCEALRDRVGALKLRLHVFGHVHESYGIVKHPDVGGRPGTVFVNASTCDLGYRPVNKPVVVDL